MQMISLKYDFMFKALFENETVCKYFLSDMLGIPPEDIRSVSMRGTHLLRHYAGQKEGVLDFLAEMNDDTMIHVELQIKKVICWDKREMFYLSKVFSDGLHSGEQYEKLKRCIGIG